MIHIGFPFYPQRRAILSYVEGLSDAFRLSADDLAIKKEEKKAQLDRSIKYALAMPMVQPCQGTAMRVDAVPKFVKIRQTEKKSYEAGLKAADEIRSWLDCV